MFLDNKSVAIIGGGPGGLTLARLLQQQGVSVKVYERDKNRFIRQQGATLDLHYESGLKAINACDLIEEFRENYRPGAERITITDNLATVRYTERDQAPVVDFDSPYARPEIDRGPLRDLLIESLDEGTVVWDSKFASLEPDGSGWTLTFEKGITAYADLVVAADGANSKVRQYMTDQAPVYSGITIVEGNIYDAKNNAPELWKLTNGGKVYALWNKKTVVLSAKGEGSLSFYTSTTEPEKWAKKAAEDFKLKENVFTWFRNRFADWSDDWHEIFTTNDSYFVVRPQYYLPASQTWETLSNITMLGDAAHLTPPSGEGVNQAMLDALELSEALCSPKHVTMRDAIHAYEQQMHLRMTEVTAESLDLVASMHAEDNLGFMLQFFDELSRLEK